MGNGDDDLIIAGYMVHEENVLALWHIMAEWISSRSYTQRVANLQGQGCGSRNNGDVFLTTKGPHATVKDDQAEDLLTGNAGTDWFFANLDFGILDTISDWKAKEFADDLDFIEGE